MTKSDLTEEEAVQILVNPIYVGLGPYPAVISEDLFIEAAEKLVEKNGLKWYLRKVIGSLRETLEVAEEALEVAEETPHVGSDVRAFTERFTVRIKQEKTGSWRIVEYAPTLELALEAAKKRRDYVWAVFEGRAKVVDSREWVAEANWPEV